MDEIERNGYNLNISRYVSTNKGEDAIDLHALHQQLVALAEKSREAAE